MDLFFYFDLEIELELEDGYLEFVFAWMYKIKGIYYKLQWVCVNLVCVIGSGTLILGITYSIYTDYCYYYVDIGANYLQKSIFIYSC